MRILVLEDDPQLADWLRTSLSTEGHNIDCFDNGRDALIAGASTPYDALILDRMVPELDGLSVLKSLRAANVRTPAIFLTAMSDIEDRVEGLRAGGDDYLLKPFAMSELVARLEALIRRPQVHEERTKTELSGGGVVLDLLARTCQRDGDVIALNAKEFRLLECLMRNAGRVMTRAMLLERVWDMNFDPTTSVVESHMSRLRSKLDKPYDRALITTIRGSGYRFDA